MFHSGLFRFVEWSVLKERSFPTQSRFFSKFSPVSHLFSGPMQPDCTQDSNPHFSPSVAFSLSISQSVYVIQSTPPPIPIPPRSSSLGSQKDEETGQADPTNSI